MYSCVLSLCFRFDQRCSFFSLCQGSDEEWVEAGPQAQTAKAWQVPNEPKAEKNPSAAQDVQVKPTTRL